MSSYKKAYISKGCIGRGIGRLVLEHSICFSIIKLIHHVNQDTASVLKPQHYNAITYVKCSNHALTDQLSVCYRYDNPHNTWVTSEPVKWRFLTNLLIKRIAIVHRKTFGFVRKLHFIIKHQIIVVWFPSCVTFVTFHK